MFRKNIFFLTAFLATSSNAFVVPNQGSIKTQQQQQQQHTLSRTYNTALSLMSKEDVDQLLKQSNECVSECTVDEVDDLIDILKSQQTGLYNRVQTIKKMITNLEALNDAGDDRKVDEVRETVRALFRVFQLGDKASGNDYPSLSKPMGWSGEVGKGPQSAYDCLPPKPYKPDTKKE